MKILAAIAVAGTATLGNPAAVRSDPLGSAVTQFTLANSLEVVVIPDRRTPVVTHMIWYRVGSADEDPGRSGLAHFLEHLMFKGTAKNPAGRFSETLATLGGQENAFTTQDYTAYFQRISREHLETVMDFEADRMTGLVLTDANVQAERDVVLEERRSRTDNDPAAQLGEAAQAALFVNHPYGRPVIGWDHEIRALSREDALAFYRRFYAPNNAIVVIAGDVTPEEVRALAEKNYGRIERRADLRPRMRPTEPEPRAHRHVSLADPRVQQPIWSRTYLVPSYRSANSGEAEALDVLAHILGSGSISRLYRTLVVEKGIAANAGSRFGGTALDSGRFSLYASPRPGVSLEDLGAAIDAVVAEIAANGITEPELARAKTKLVAEAVYAQDNQSTLARWYGSGVATGLDVDQIRTWPDRVRQVSAQSVQNAARTWLDLRRAVTGHLVKAPAATEKRS